MSRRVLSFAVAMSLTIVASVQATPITLRIQGPAGEPNGSSGSPAVSADGRSVAFRSNATNLPVNPAGGSLFVFDVGTRGITSLTPSANGSSDRASISADGRYIAFETQATNIGTGGVNGEGTDIMRIDRQSGEILRASRGVGGIAANAGSSIPAISADGRYVAFTSYATNLVTPAPTGGLGHVYLMDFNTGVISLLDQTAQGVYANKDTAALEANAMSSDGTRIVFSTEAENLTTVNIGNVGDVLVRTRNPGTGAVTFENVNRNAAGAVGTLSSSRGSISPNGRYVVFRSQAPNITPVPSMSGLYVRDLNANALATVALPVGYNTCDRARVNDLGDVLMQCSPLAPATAIQLHYAPRDGSSPRLVSRNIVGTAGNQSSSFGFTMSGDGGVIGFESAATDLISVDQNVSPDVFVAGEPGVLDRLFADGFE
jgi:Tol biopolymer transport system component